MGLLANFERRLSALLEGGFARLFRGGLPPSEVVRAAGDAAAEARRDDGLRVACNLVRLVLHPDDLAELQPHLERLRREAAERIAQRARERGLELVGRPRLELTAAEEVRRGTCQASAEVVEGPGAAELVDPDGRVILGLSDQPVELGRDSDCDLILDVSDVSRRHARIEPGPRGWVLCDLGSTNGTRVNGRSAGRQPLADGDRLEFGPVRLTFRER